MNDLELTIHLSDEYEEAFMRARTMTDLRKCRCWFDKTTVTDDQVAVKLTSNAILIRYHTSNGEIQDNCTYEGVLGVTELREGIMLRLSGKRLLFLPAVNDRRETELLMGALRKLEEHCKYIFKKAELDIHKAGLLAQFDFRLRPKQGYYMGDRYTNGAVLLLICATVFIATVFVSKLSVNRIVPVEDAIAVTASYLDCDPAYRRGSTRYIDLEFTDHEELTIPGICSNKAMVDRLDSIPEGTKLNLLVHPVSEDVLQIENDGELLMEFDYAQTRIWRDAVAFGVLGGFLYLCAGYLLVGVIRKKL